MIVRKRHVFMVPKRVDWDEFENYLTGRVKTFNPRRKVRRHEKKK